MFTSLQVKTRLKHEVYLHDKNIRFVIHNDIQLVYSVSLCTQMFGIGVTLPNWKLKFPNRF